MRKALSLAFIVAASAASTLSADEIRLVGGDVLKGTVVSETETAVTIDHAALGRIEIARDRIAEVIKTTPTPPPAPPAVAVDEAKPAPAPAVPVAVLPAPVPPPPPAPDGSWKFSLSLGFTGSDNETSSNWDVRAAASAKRESESDRTTVAAEYYFNSANSVNTDNNLLVTAQEDFLFKDSKWEAFVKGYYQYDEFQAWESRAGVYAGPAYRLLEGEPLALRLRAGAGASYDIPESNWTPELLLGNDLVWTIDERSKLIQGLDFFPDLENFGEYRFIFRVDYEIALSPKGDLKGTAGVRDEYDSYVEPTGDSSNDLKIYAGIKVDF
ncbi:MAG: hypothetical protein RLY21_1094 [Planctomycetota bacterium]|jgi:hypothetical protein